MCRVLPVLALFGVVAMPVLAQDAANPAHVAGYKAAFTCSATFNASLDGPVIAANELTGIYPDYRAQMAALPEAQINESARTVSVFYAEDMPPRIAAWRPGFGCSQLPQGARLEDAAWLPRFESWMPAGGPDRASAIGYNVQITLPVHITDRLEAPVSFAFDGQTYGAGTQTSAVVVVRGGEVVAERYDRGIGPETPQRTWSVAKSITATILGAAANDGIIGPDSTALLAEWRAGGDPRRNITLANLLHMNSGLETGPRGSRTDAVYFGGARVTDTALNASLAHPPGTRFNYSNNDTLAAIRALREAIGDDVAFHNYPYREVLWKIGARRTTLETDWNGDFISSSQVWTTARDLARIGQLYLNDGRWAGEQILHPDWKAFVMTPAPAQPDIEFGYGAQFWLMDGLAGIPRDAFAAMGHRGQYVVIIPSEDLVIVRRGYDESGGTRFDIAGFTRDVVASIRVAEAARLQAEEEARLAEMSDSEREAYLLERAGGGTQP